MNKWMHEINQDEKKMISYSNWIYRIISHINTNVKVYFM